MGGVVPFVLLRYAHASFSLITTCVIPAHYVGDPIAGVTSSVFISAAIGLGSQLPVEYVGAVMSGQGIAGAFSFFFFPLAHMHICLHPI